MAVIDDVLAQSQRDLLRREWGATNAAANAYGQAYQRTERHLQVIRQRLADPAYAGRQAELLRREAWYQEMQKSIEAEWSHWELGTARAIDTAQAGAVGAAGNVTKAIARITRTPVPAATYAAAFERWVGASRAGSPVRKIIAGYGADISNTILQKVNEGFAGGQGAGTIIREIRKAAGPAAQNPRIATLVRTETNRAYRGAFRDQMKPLEKRNIITGYTWKAALTPRTCLACVGLHGTYFKAYPTGFHPNCRCVARPIVDETLVPGANPPVESGEAWLRRQPEDVQRKVLRGPARYERFKAGNTLSQMTGFTQDKTWGKTYRIKGLADVPQPGTKPRPQPRGPRTPKPAPTPPTSPPVAPPVPKPAPTPPTPSPKPGLPGGHIDPPALKGTGVTYEPTRSSRMLLDRDKKYRDQGKKRIQNDANLAINRIDRVHKVPASTPRLKLDISDTGMRHSTAGHYAPDWDFRTRNPTPGKPNTQQFGMTPDHIRLNSGSRADHMVNTMTHEFGHYVDNQVLARYLGSPQMGQTFGYASEFDHPLMNKWREAVHESTAGRTMLNKASAKYATDYARYAVEDKEFFARSYAQWVATKTDDAKGLAEIAARRLDEPGWSWTPDDFLEIGQAFDDIFDGLGLLEKADDLVDFRNLERVALDQWGHGLRPLDRVDELVRNGTLSDVQAGALRKGMDMYGHTDAYVDHFLEVKGFTVTKPRPGTPNIRPKGTPKPAPTPRPTPRPAPTTPTPRTTPAPRKTPQPKTDPWFRDLDPGERVNVLEQRGILSRTDAATLRLDLQYYPGDPQKYIDDYVRKQGAAAPRSTARSLIAASDEGPPPTPEAFRVSEKLHEKASRAEPGVTATLRRLETGGADLNRPFKLANGQVVSPLDNRLKTVNSTAGKVMRDAVEAQKLAPDVPLPRLIDQAAAGINDNLRYTYTLNPTTYGDDVARIIQGLDDAGYQRVNVKNFWAKDNGYTGVHAIYRTPDGQPFEVQFHTELTLQVKELESHPLYELQKGYEPGSPEWVMYQRQIDAVWRRLRDRLPVNLSGLP